MRLIAKNVLKIKAAGIIAFLLLCVLCAIYYNPSTHFPSPTGATDYIREPDALYSYMTEGFSIGRTDSNGFNNFGQMAENSNSPDVLFMGSSHIEAMYVSQKQNAPYILNELLKPQEIKVYNIAMSAHNFMYCMNNLDVALASYKPQRYVVIETMSITFAVEEMEKLLAGNFPKGASVTKADWKYWVQQPPYIKLMYNQYRNVLKEMKKVEQTIKPVRDEAKYRELLEKTIVHLSETVLSHNIEPILFFHPTLKIQPDGSAVTTYDKEDIALLSQICAEQNVKFIDMTDIFTSAYINDYVLPHGFANTEIGTGHMNQHGQRMVAEALYNAITQGGTTV